MRMNGLWSHSRPTVVGSEWPGWISVAESKLHERPHDRVLDRLVGRVAGGAHAADGVAEEGVAGEDGGRAVVLDEEREHSARMTRRAQRADRELAGGEAVAGVDRARRGRDEVALERADQDRRRPASAR